MAAWCLCTSNAVAMSAAYDAPVELTGRLGAPCAHVTLGTPSEARQGWSIEVKSLPEGAVVWHQEADDDRARPAPATGRDCVRIEPSLLQRGRPYRVELSTHRLYRSDFCWSAQGASDGGPTLRAVDERNGQCSHRAWVGGDGDAMTPRGWWPDWRRWWHGLTGYSR